MNAPVGRMTVGALPVTASGFPSYSRAECGSVQGAQEHHRAGEPLCELCQRWSDERHRRTRVPAGSRCGTPAGAQMHRQLGEKVCERCAPGRPKRPMSLSRAEAKKLAYGHAARTLETSLETREDFFDLYPDADDRQRVIDGLREIIDALFRRADG